MDKLSSIVTSRIVLRQITLKDIPDLIRHANDKSIADNILNIPYPYQESDAIHRMNFVLQGFKNKERFVFVIAEKETNQLIGEIGLHLDTVNNKAEMGYWVSALHRGKGIATEAVKHILQFGFETLALQKIYATHFLSNPASGLVLLKNGMIKEAELKDHYKHNGVYGSVIQYRMTLDEYQNLSK